MNKLEIFIIGVIFGILSTTIIFHSCVSPAAAAENFEWECSAKPEKGTKNSEYIETIAYNEDKSEAERQAIWLCNRFYKTNKCKITYCKKVRER